MTCIVTFYSHYEAICHKRDLEKAGIPVQLMPVPRTLSSSCGTCARFTCEVDPVPLLQGEYEQVVREEVDGTFTVLKDNR